MQIQTSERLWMNSEAAVALAIWTILFILSLVGYR